MGARAVARARGALAVLGARGAWETAAGDTTHGMGKGGSELSSQGCGSSPLHPTLPRRHAQKAMRSCQQAATLQHSWNAPLPQQAEKGRRPRTGGGWGGLGDLTGGGGDGLSSGEGGGGLFLGGGGGLSAGGGGLTGRGGLGGLGGRGGRGAGGDGGDCSPAGGGGRRRRRGGGGVAPSCAAAKGQRGGWTECCGWWRFRGGGGVGRLQPGAHSQYAGAVRRLVLPTGLDRCGPLAMHPPPPNAKWQMSLWRRF